MFIFPTFCIYVAFFVYACELFSFIFDWNERKTMCCAKTSQKRRIDFLIDAPISCKKPYDSQCTFDEGWNSAYTQKKNIRWLELPIFLSKAIFFSCRQQTVSITVIAMKTTFPLSNLNRPSNDTISHYWKRCLVIKKN